MDVCECFVQGIPVTFVGLFGFAFLYFLVLRQGFCYVALVVLVVLTMQTRLAWISAILLPLPLEYWY